MKAEGKQRPPFTCGTAFQNRPTSDNESRGPVTCNGMLASAPSKHGAQFSDAQKVMVVVL